MLLTKNIIHLCIVRLILIFSIFVALVNETQAGTYTADSANLSDVAAAVNLAASGDTVLVPAKSATWSGTLSINKGIILKGAGIGNTVITSATTNFLIHYQPSATAWVLNAPLRISGFTFDQANQSAGGAINLDQAYGVPSGSVNMVQSNIRIDHNRFMNSSVITNQSIRNWGMRGVVDNNTFDDIAYPIREDQGYAQSWWDNWGPIKYGAANDTMYFEDNTFNNVSYLLSDCQYGNRYSFRYNAINLSANPSNLGYHQTIDMHGNQPTAYNDMYSCFGGELYGNKVNNSNISSVEFLDQRGGKVLGFNNYFFNTPGMYIQLRDEVDDSVEPTVNQPQHVTQSYYWNNRRTGGAANNSLVIPGVLTVVLGHPAENSDFFLQHNSTFDGTSGVGAGPLANRPATCTQGVGYWATTQSVSDLSAMVGAHPATPITGTLYKCSPTNTWSFYYTPLEYPHSLTVRGPTSDGGGGASPAAPHNFRISQ